MTDFQSTITSILHGLTQALQAPIIIILLLLALLVLFYLGTFIVEYFTDRRRYKVSMPQLINEMNDCPLEDTGRVIAESGLLKRQRILLIVLFNNRSLPPEMRFALARRLVNRETNFYQSITGHTDLLSKIAPMFGLMGTLVPLGPGIQALSTGETDILSAALLVAFDTTVAGLLVAAIAVCISKVRKRWYAQYIYTFEAAVSCLIDKLENAEAGIEPKPHAKPYWPDLSAHEKRAAERFGDPLDDDADGRGVLSLAKSVANPGGTGRDGDVSGANRGAGARGGE